MTVADALGADDGAGTSDGALGAEVVNGGFGMGAGGASGAGAGVHAVATDTATRPKALAASRRRFDSELARRPTRRR